MIFPLTSTLEIAEREEKMLTKLSGCPLVALGLLCPDVAAAQRSKPARSVQLISMIPKAARAPADEATGATNGSKLAPTTGTPTPSEAFRTHDLSRQWVTFEMARSFASSGQAALPSTDRVDTLARVGVAQLNPAVGPSASRTAPAIAIPEWMRVGQSFATTAMSFAPGCAANGYHPTGFLDQSAENRRFGYYAMMSNIACEYGIPIGLFDAMIIRESRYNSGIVSPKRAFGLTQLMPDTAAGLGVDRYDVEQNLRGGARYLREQLDSFGQVHLALAAYNAGPGRVRNGLVPRIAETQAYVDNVLMNWRRLADFPRAAVGFPGTQAVPLPQPMKRVATVYSY